MCGCEKHQNKNAECTCICEEHHNFYAARHLAFQHYDEVVRLSRLIDNIKQALDDFSKKLDDTIRNDEDRALARIQLAEALEKIEA